MDEHKVSDNAAKTAINKPQTPAPEAAQPLSAPTTDPTNPHNQEPIGVWVANERAAERRNIEPGLTDAERKRRRL